MKYFLHDSNSFNDEKISELYLRFGYEGLGIFYTLLEKLAYQEKPIKTIVLKSQLNIGKRLEKCWLFMEEIQLISSNNGETFNKQLLNFSEKYNIKKENNTKRISEWRKNQEIKENVTHYESVSDTPKVNESKVNISKVKDKRKTKVFIAPTIEEIKSYFKENGYTENSGSKAFNYYSVADWKDSKGNPVLNWKQKMQSVWFKDENKDKALIPKQKPKLALYGS